MSRRFWFITLCLALLAPATILLRNWQVGRLAEREDTLRARAVLGAYNRVDDDLRSIQAEMLALGNAIANAPIVRQGLDEARHLDGPTTNPSLVEFVSQMQLPEHMAIELHTPVPRLVAWLGYSMPLDDAPAQLQFLEGYQTAISTDADRRTALALWVPVRDGPTIYGGVRVLRMLRSDAPVQNAYLEDYDITEDWVRRTHIPLRTVYSAPFDDELPAQGDVRLLQGLDGRVFGRVFVDRPSGEQLIQNVRARYDDVIAFWIAIFAGWLVAVAYGYYKKSDRSQTLRSIGFRFAVVVSLLIGYRFLLVSLDLPNRLQRGKAPLAPLYDPTHLASSLYGGSLRSIGDFALTALFVGMIGLLLYHFVALVLERVRPFAESRSVKKYRALSLLGVVASVGALSLVVAFLSRLTGQVILDSTLDYFARTGLLPESLVLSVFVSLLLVAVGGVIVFSAFTVCGLLCYRYFVGDDSGRVGRSVVAGIVTVVVFIAVGKATSLLVPGSTLLILSVVALLIASSFMVYRFYRQGVLALTLRNVLLGIFWVTAIMYPLVYNGMELQRRNRLTDAIESFDDGRDPRVLFAIDRILLNAESNPAVRSILSSIARQNASAVTPRASRAISADSLATGILRRSLLASMGTYEVSLSIFDGSSRSIGSYYESDQRLTPNAVAELEQTDFEIIREMYTAAGTTGPLVEPITGRRERERFRYQGLLPVSEAGQVIGWIMASAEPRSIIEEAVTPFPRVLVPSGFYGNLQGNVSLAEFRDGVLIRNTGSGFGRYRLSDDATLALSTSGDVWRREVDRGKDYDTFYHRRIEDSRVTIGERTDVVIASRMPAITTFDHLYYLLRLTVSGLFLGIPIYLYGLYLRRSAGLLPAPAVRFRDKVLNAFFGVGLITVAAMGFVGLQVVTGENERAIDSWLKQHLERVEKTLFMDAQAGELAYSVMDRTSLDSLATRVGLDLNLYRGIELVASSRPQLIEDRLIDQRLPMQAYKALFFDGFRFTATDEHVGDFKYTAGFRALTDEEGRPYYVVSVPTLPEQERIEEERARTVAYLFGALLLLVLAVLVTASILANALTRPIMRLREGLEAVSRGQFSQITPFESRDEFGELVQTFNTMQDQLADSRRQVAQQERQLAWREMARQVAHEIKNPLTPMKLSIQHLRRSFDSSDDRDSKQFEGMFGRITTTLVEQIDALARIANEFSTFARMPQRILEELDLNAVAREAAALMEAEGEVSIKLDLFKEPLVVHADREELRRIFINLIKNGIQSVPDDRQGQIKIVTRRESFKSEAPRDQLANEALPGKDEESKVSFAGTDSKRGSMVYSEVIDNGSGIPAELRARIFEPNFSTKTSGTGLGLAIVRKSIEDLNGEIGFRTKPGQGTRFWIRLPEVPASEKPRIT